MNFEAGKIVKLTNTVHVTLGAVVTVDLHPSGIRFDGPAVVTSAFLGTLGKPMIHVVALADPTHRKVARSAEDFAEFTAA